jgi:hypothetical protein
LALWATLAAGLIPGCEELPEVKYEMKHIDLATDFDAPVCRGTRVALDQRFEFVSKLTGEDKPRRMLLYWVDHDIERVCSGEKLGCFIPGTRITAAYGEAMHHEIVHAVLDTRGRNMFIEEGLAEYLAGYPVVFNPDRGDPLRQLSRGDAVEEHVGAFSYPAAASFAHFLGAEGGDALLEELVAAVDDGVSGSTIEHILEDEFDMGGPALEVRYREEATTVMPGLSQDRIPRIDLDELEAVHRFGIECVASDTYGPLETQHAEGYQIERFFLPGPTTLRWRVSGPPGSWAALMRAYDFESRRALDWLHPDMELDHLRIGEGTGFVEAELSRGEYALIVVAPAEGKQEVYVEITDLDVTYEGPHRGPPDAGPR